MYKVSLSKRAERIYKKLHHKLKEQFEEVVEKLEKDHLIKL
jgi:mRNA-degrading endonuclease RelE of RelBE toxin-antitoxin system